RLRQRSNHIRTAAPTKITPTSASVAHKNSMVKPARARTVALPKIRPDAIGASRQVTGGSVVRRAGSRLRPRGPTAPFVLYYSAGSRGRDQKLRGGDNNRPGALATKDAQWVRLRWAAFSDAPGSTRRPGK